MTINEIIAYLNDNENKKVSTVKNELINMISELTKRKTGPAQTHIRDANNEVIAIFCYYHKKWEILEHAEYGLKKHSTHGFNTMCKEGVSRWTKQNNKRKQIGNIILEELSSGILNAESIALRKQELEEECNIVIAREDGHGFDSIDQVKTELNIV